LFEEVEVVEEFGSQDPPLEPIDPFELVELSLR
jgi:hypothetical protein